MKVLRESMSVNGEVGLFLLMAAEEASQGRALDARFALLHSRDHISAHSTREKDNHVPKRFNCPNRLDLGPLNHCHEQD